MSSELPKSLFLKWSSHPVSLARQRKTFFWICLLPSAAVAACLVLFLSGLSGWKALLTHPTVLFWIVAGTASLTLGLAVCLALLYLFARSGIARKTDDEDRLPFPKALVVIFSFFWIVPTALTFVQGHFGVSIFPPQLVFVLNALCLAPLIVLLLWVRYAAGKPEGADDRRSRTARRPLWFVLGLFFLGLALFALLGDVQRWVGSLSLPIRGISNLALRVVLLAGLLPLSMVCFACWALFRKVLPPEKPAPEEAGAASGEQPPRKRSLWQRFLDLFRSGPGSAKAGGDDEDDTPPAWLEQLCQNLPAGVRMNTATEGVPDRLPAPDAPVSEEATSEEADNLWLLMGGEDGQRPTELQTEFFLRFREAWEESRLAAQKGNSMSPDMILSGDEGTGRTEVLLAVALYAAIARRQRVLYLVPDSHQAEMLARRLEKRCSDLFLEAFISCGILRAEQARKWIDSLKAKYSDESDVSGAPIGDAADIVPPNVLLATPRDVERILFEGHGLFLKGEDIAPLRELFRLFEVTLVDDFMGLDSMTRAHLPFLLHKMRLLLVSCNIQPQFVVSLPRLNENGGEAFLASRLYGSAGFNKQNAVTLLPRKCQPAWSVPLVVQDGARKPSAVCEELVRRCVEIDPTMSIVLYQKGLPPHKCRELASRLGASSVRVIARLDEIGENRAADAVLYQTALAGRSGMALRLTVGDAQTVYLSVSSESEALMAREQMFPAIPDETAVSLRIRHLRSLLRFIVPGQPIELAAWERFGVSLSDRHIRKIDKTSGATILETWRQDEWTDPSYGSPLWPYVVLEKSESVKSNAGSEVDFGVLPYADEDVVQIGDAPLLGLGRPHARTDEDGDVAIGTGIGSVAQWTEKGRPQGFIDLAHAERLVLGRSEHGENLAGAADAAVSVFTVDTFHDGNESCQFQMEIRPWTGDGTDFDTPVRAFSWMVEPVSEPKYPRIAPGRTFGFFDLPPCRDIPRTMNGTIFSLVSRYGQEVQVSPVRSYSYPACFSGVLLAPRKMDSRNMGAVIQRGVFGKWDSEQPTFSFVLTHLLSGVMRRVIPDFSFYAVLPVFHMRDNASSVAAAVAWLVQPLNSGKVIDGLVRDVLMSADGQRKVVAALQEAFSLMDAQRDMRAKLRWLRSFSGSAFYFDDTRRSEADQQGSFDEDVRLSRETVDAVKRRLDGEVAEIEGLVDPVPSVDADDSWMTMPRQFEKSAFGAADAWKMVATLPSAPAVRAGGISFSWNFGQHDFQLEAGFADAAARDSYDSLVNRHFRARACGDCYTEYGVNDPYRDFVGEVYGRLQGLFADAFPDGGTAQFAEFLLSFVQGAIAYVKDPHIADTDWPRYPSETLMLGGGDCEDSSILYAELLRLAKIENAILSVPQHAAVGVNVPMEWTSSRKEPVKYVWLGKTYVYAETANDKFVTPLGEETALIPSSTAIKADVIPTPLDAAGHGLGVRILNAVWGNGALTVTVCATSAVSGSALAVYGRAKKFVYERPDEENYPFLGGTQLPPLKPFEVWEATVRLSCGEVGAERYWLDVFACDMTSGTVLGHFVGAARLAKG